MPGVPPEFTGDVTFFGNNITDNYSGQTFVNERMTTYSIFDRDLQAKGKNPAFTLNRFNLEAMAERLLPRAVGYTAGLINYFFRGDIDLAKVGTDQYVIKNNSNEAMSGDFSLYYDGTDGNRYPVPGAAWNLSVSANGQSAAVAFTDPTTPAPQETGKYILVFQGTHGSEEGAVAGKVISPGGVWEGWNAGLYNTLELYTSSWFIWDTSHTNNTHFNFITEHFTLDTDKRTWEGWRTAGASPEASISIEGGAIKFNAYTGNHPLPGYSNYYTSHSHGWVGTTDVISLAAGCRLKMTIPVANVGYDYSGYQGNNRFLIELRITDGTMTPWGGIVHYPIVYAVDAVTYTLNSWDQNFYIFIPTGELDLSLEDAFNHLKSVFWWNTFGDISNWEIDRVVLSYNIPGKDNFMNVSIDYIDFVCQ